MATIAERVARGAALLDEERPGWEHKIDLDTLDLSDCTACVIGQTVGIDEAELGILALTGDDDDGLWPPRLGFSLFGYAGPERRRQWRNLTEAWKVAIRARLAAQNTTP